MFGEHVAMTSPNKSCEQKCRDIQTVSCCVGLVCFIGRKNDHVCVHMLQTRFQRPLYVCRPRCRVFYVTVEMMLRMSTAWATESSVVVNTLTSVEVRHGFASMDNYHKARPDQCVDSLVGVALDILPLCVSYAVTSYSELQRSKNVELKRVIWQVGGCVHLIVVQQCVHEMVCLFTLLYTLQIFKTPTCISSKM